MNAEEIRLHQDAQRSANWRRWGPWLPERQWGTVREDYSAGGTCWSYLPHDHARSRAYRWGEDGILGFTDRQCRLCLAPALWNGQDPILKERLFGLTNEEGNHGEDAKECWWHLEATPTASYCKGLYRYPMAAFPYGQLLEENRRRGLQEREFELEDTGIFAEGRYWDVQVELAKAAPDDLVWRITVRNASAQRAQLHLLPQVWFRNTWSWGCKHEGCGLKPRLRVRPDGGLDLWQEDLGDWIFTCDGAPQWLCTENETNSQRLFGSPGYSPYVKDGIGRRVVEGDCAAVHPDGRGTKAAAWFVLNLEAGASYVCTARMRPAALGPGNPAEGEAILRARAEECAQFYQERLHRAANEHDATVARRAYAGLIWSQKFYHYIVRDWLEGDPEQPAPPNARFEGRNADWRHLYNRDVISLPDAWEYPWYASWDLAFHCVALARVDIPGAKRQLELFLREWYLHPNGQMPAYEFSLGDVNPPVHAWACWRVYRLEQATGQGDLDFLERVFHKLLFNFTWWVNRKDSRGRNLFSGGFLGLDNIGPFDRSKPPPDGWFLDQADGTAWMAFFAGRMLTIALELARHRRVYEDIASKFLEHVVAIADAMNQAGGAGLWHEEDGFYYDYLRRTDGSVLPLRLRSLVGVVPLFASTMITQETLRALPGFAKRLQWFRTYRSDLAAQISFCSEGREGRLLIAIPSRERLQRVLSRLADSEEFLGDYGVRSLSRIHAQQPFTLLTEESQWRVAYTPGESTSGLFGGNSNWRGPIWFPLNLLLIEALERYHSFYGDTVQVQVAGQQHNLRSFSQILSQRLGNLFRPNVQGQAPWQGGHPLLTSPDWRDLTWFHEYFHGDTGRGLGASHQTGWTALVAPLLAGETLRQSTTDSHVQ